MRIEGWRVDGFGVLKDVEQSGLAAGVTVLLGENEAGKSTLLAFVRGVLFGFPDGRSRERSYPPVLGGRPGGRLLLRDAEDGLWTVGRYADDRKTVLLLRPDGTSGEAAELAVLLGGVDAQVFKSVFAFGVDELQAFETLTGEGVRERIFSAGISGAGRSAREVIKRLEQRQDGLLKQRGGRAAINDLVRELQRVDGEVQEARALAGRYEALQGEEREQVELAGRLQREGDALQRRASEVAAFLELRSQWDELHEKRLELAGLPRTADESLPATVAGLVAELEAQKAREERLPELERTAVTEGGAVDAASSRLGDGWPIERVKSFDTSIAVEDAVRAWDESLADAAQALHEAEGARATAEDAAGRAQAHADDLRSELPEVEPLAVGEIDRRESLLGSLREQAARLEVLRLQDEQAAASRRTARPTLAYVLAVVAAVAAAVVWIAGNAELGIGLAVAAVLAAVAGVLSVRRGTGSGASGAADAARPGVLEALRAAVAETAAELGLPAQPSATDLATCEASLRTQRTLRADWDNARRRVADAERQAAGARLLVADARGDEERAEKSMAESAAGWASWLRERDLGDLSPAGVLEVLRQVAEARAADVRLGVAADGIADIARRAEAWEAEARSALEAAGRSAAGLSSEAVRAAVIALDRDLERRATLAAQIDAIERTVAVRLGACEDPDTAADELASGDVGVWQDEAARLDEEVARLRGERDGAIEAATTARSESRRIEESADIPRLQEEGESLLAQLADLAREYRVVSAARSLIGDTLRTYVQERQPAVLEAGSAAFATVTNGRYVRVQPDEEGAFDTFVVLDRAGVRLQPDQLSRGTQQQLYLAIRLALVEEFARRTVPLPLIMDDCLVHFDPKRAAAVAGLLAERSVDGQCLLFTCHPETAELMVRQTGGPVRVIEMPVRGGPASTE